VRVDERERFVAGEHLDAKRAGDREQRPVGTQR